MSLSPSQRDAHKRSKRSKRSKPADAEPLTLSQALLITAGMAGLVGLCSGALLRFSIANSADARFLSPLQTFPALSDWTSELPEETADRDPSGGRRESRESYSEDFQTDSTILTFEPAEPVEESASKPISESLDTSVDADSEPTDVSTFDTFADRSKGRRRTTAPLDLLEKGPDLRGLRQTTPERSFPYDAETQGDIFDDSERYDLERYNSERYEETYRDDGYYEDDSYEGDRYNDGNYYPPTDESIEGNNAYYD